MAERRSADPRKLLVVQTAFVGDVVLTTGLLRCLRSGFPRAELAMLATPAGAALLEGQPWVDRIHVFDKRGRHRGLRGLWRLAAWLREERFDAALAAHRSLRTALLLRMAGIRRLIGFEGAPGSFLYTERVDWATQLHAAERYATLARPLGLEPQAGDRAPRLVPRPEAREAVARKLEQRGLVSRPVALVAPGSVWATKRWLPERFAEVARALAGEGFGVVVTGSEGERPLAERVAAGVGTVLAGEDLPLAELVALAARARVCVGNDSGASHIAAAVGTPTVVIYGPTHPRQGLGPRGPHVRAVQHETLDCRPCHAHGPRRCPLGHFRCMRELPASRVLEAVRAARG